MIKVKREPDTFSVITHNYDLDVNKKEVEISKRSYCNSITNEYEDDYEILSVKNKDDEDVELTEKELNELDEFIHTL